MNKFDLNIIYVHFNPLFINLTLTDDITYNKEKDNIICNYNILEYQIKEINTNIILPSKQLKNVSKSIEINNISKLIKWKKGGYIQSRCINILFNQFSEWSEWEPFLFISNQKNNNKLIHTGCNCNSDEKEEIESTKPQNLPKPRV